MRNIPASDITQFLSELATLLQSNHSCQEALTIIQYGQDNRALLQFITTVHSNVKQGISLADSLAKYPQYLEPFLVTMLRDEENLVTTLFKIVEYREAIAVSTTDLAHRLRTSLNYFWTVVVPLLFLFITLVFIIVVGDFPSKSALWLFSGSALIVGGWLWIQRQSVTLHVPLLGRLYRKMVLVRFLRTCAFMLSNNASLVEALQASAQAVHHPTYARYLRQLTDQVIAGTTLAEALLKQPAFPAEVAHAEAMGTQAHQLEKWFINLAEVYTQQLHQAIEHTIKFLKFTVNISLAGWSAGVFQAVFGEFLDPCQAPAWSAVWRSILSILNLSW
jgi:type IV pilus assembly protein PilC